MSHSLPLASALLAQPPLISPKCRYSLVPPPVLGAMDNQAPDDVIVQVNAAAVRRSSTCQIEEHVGDDHAKAAGAGLTRRTFSESYKMRHRNPLEFTRWQVAVLSYQSLGVVYGHIGTSPLYTFSSFTLPDPGEVDFLGILSLILWTLTLVSPVKYVFIVLHADDHEEEEDPDFTDDGETDA
uniref:K+ potassium transporter integral membrane domain-containing protein n=1 Tax=Arundo donax TaxID=35708 RepID=A0A0A9AGG3_ARUDO